MSLTDTEEPTAVEEYRLPVGWPTMTAVKSVPRMTPFIPHNPLPKQRFFLSLRCLEAFYGGAAGPGKSDALLMAALQFVDVPKYSALILRKTLRDLELPDALMARAHDWLDGTDAQWHARQKQWEFPSGATLTFGYCLTDKDVQSYRSAAFQYIGIDESTQFTEFSYRFLFSRVRRPAVPCLQCERPLNYVRKEWQHAEAADHEPVPDQAQITRLGRSAMEDGLSILEVPLRMRTASNPGDVGHVWHKRRFVDKATRLKRAVFVAARLEDNPYLDPVSYERSLREMDPVNWMRMRHGDWEVRDPGELFEAVRIEVVPAMFNGDQSVRRVRYWDLAATKVEANKDPDWTVGFRLALDNDSGLWRIEHIARTRDDPAKIEKLMRDTAEWDGRDVHIHVEQEPGSEGKSYMSYLRRQIFRGFQFRPDPVHAVKDSRIRMLEPIVNNGDVTIVAGPWVQDFLDELDGWPNVTHDDQLDAFAGAHRMLTRKGTRLMA